MTTVIPDQPPEPSEPFDLPPSATADPTAPTPDAPTDDEAVTVIAAARAWLVAIGYRRPGSGR
ncbi:MULTISPECIES: hypothetical protein [unclassified Streptomyces]|uniref:hypothetical protein n=1 Tax=unclassified Streptomyces TaxID=2593676 RepID=UPI00190429DE|nr:MULTISPECIES: hypothetical protein [unclassified Streptomyces]MCU4749154.1 hypothetical protein [Streptomyces sp. G-5]QQN77301.1 hypothetical protein IPZ77_07420 [Streptomyces sp. XC 2026]